MHLPQVFRDFDSNGVRGHWGTQHCWHTELWSTEPMTSTFIYGGLVCFYCIRYLREVSGGNAATGDGGELVQIVNNMHVCILVQQKRGDAQSELQLADSWDAVGMELFTRVERKGWMSSKRILRDRARLATWTAHDGCRELQVCVLRLENAPRGWQLLDVAMHLQGYMEDLILLEFHNAGIL